MKRRNFKIITLISGLIFYFIFTNLGFADDSALRIFWISAWHLQVSFYSDMRSCLDEATDL
jgi:hypothetical protein